MNEYGPPPSKPVARYVQKSPSPVAPGSGYAPYVFPRTSSRSSSNALSTSPSAHSSPYDMGHRSPLAGPGIAGGSSTFTGALRSFAPQHVYEPPPPMPRQQGHANIYDDDANPEAACSPTHNLNRSIRASLSPHVEERYPTLGVYRPMSAASYAQGPSTRETRSLQRAASSVAPGFHAKPPKVLLSDRCGAVVCDRDSISNAVVARYQCGAQLGKGGFANVFEFVDLSTGVVYACKVIDRSKLTRHSEAGVLEEIDIHKRMSHPNVVRLVKSFTDDYFFYILLERCSTKNLMDISNARGAFDKSEIQHVMRQLCSAVEYVHKRGVIHRDIKLGNIMLDFEGNVKLGDFGFAGWLGPNECKTRMCGTPNYMAPEILRCSETRQGYGFQADMWSLGVVLFILTCGYPPFQSKDIPSTYERIKRAEYTFPSAAGHPGQQISNVCQQMIVGLLQRDPARRLTMEQLKQFSLLRSCDTLERAPSTLIPPASHERGRSAYTVRLDGRAMVSPIVATPASPGEYGAAEVAMPPVRRTAASEPTTEAAARGATSPLAQYGAGAGAAGSADDDGSSAGRQCAHRRAAEEDRCVAGTATKPPVPDAVVHRSVHFNKYGYGFLLGSAGRDVPVVLLNDRTKLVYDYTHDVAVYYTRTQSIQANGMKTYYDDPRSYKNARDTLGRSTPTTTTTTRSTDAGDDAILSAASKKYAITLFLLPFLRHPTADVQIPCTTSALPVGLTDANATRCLFDDAGTGDAQRPPVYVKEVHLCSLQDLSDRYPDTQMQLTATRLSNDSYQVSVECAASTSCSLVPTPDNCAIELNWPWKMDVLLYGAGHAVVGVETGHRQIYLSFMDFANSYRTTSNGEREFTSSGQTSASARIALPPELLAVLTAALRKVRCPNETLQALS